MEEVSAARCSMIEGAFLWINGCKGVTTTYLIIMYVDDRLINRIVGVVDESGKHYGQYPLGYSRTSL